MSDDIKQVLYYTNDVYSETNVERGSVENVLWDNNSYTAYVQWSNSRNRVYVYNVSKIQWEAFLVDVNLYDSVGTALSQVAWGSASKIYYAHEVTFKRVVDKVDDSSVNTQPLYKVVVEFTGTMTLTVNGKDVAGAVEAATALFRNDETAGEIEVLEVKKVN